MSNLEDELSGLRTYLDAFDQVALRTRRGGKDVTAQEKAILEREIKYLESVVARWRSGQE